MVEKLTVYGVGDGAGPGLALEPDAARESDFDDLAAAAVLIAGGAAAVIAVPRGRLQWFRGHAGIAARSTPSEGSLAERVAVEGAELDIPDVAASPAFAADVLFRGVDGLRSAACLPILAEDGTSLGALIVLASQRIVLSDPARRGLRTICRQVTAQLELRRLSSAAEADQRRLEVAEARYQKLSVNRFAAAQAMTQLGTWEWDVTTGRMVWSEEIFRIFALQQDREDGIEPSALQIIERVHPEDQDYCRRLVHSVLKTGHRSSFRLRAVPGDGALRHLEGWVEAELDPVTGRSVRIWGTVQDVTDRVQRAAALAESEQRLRLTIETSPTGIALIGLDGRWLEANDAMAHMVGYSRESLMKLRFQDITHPDDLESDLTLLRELTAGLRSSYQLDKRYLHADGHEVWASLTASVVRRADGEPLHYVSQVEDITERRRATAELQAERDLSAALLAALHDGYAYLERGRIIVVNDVFCDMTGRSREQLIDDTEPLRFLSGDSSANASVLRDMVNDKSGQSELRLQRPDGTGLDVGIALRPVRRGDGRVRGYVALVRDITDRKLSEQRLRHRADHDGLTGLLNRAAFHVRLAERVAAAHASGSALTLAILDLDRFKLVNDQHGHPAGDVVLAEFAARLRGNARGDDAIGRLGGEEFGWIMSETGREEAIGALSRTLDAVRRHPFPHGGRLTFSAGAAQLRTYAAGPSSQGGQGSSLGQLVEETAPALLARTDRLLYEAKAAGRDRVAAAPEVDAITGATGFSQ